MAAFAPAGTSLLRSALGKKRDKEYERKFSACCKKTTGKVVGALTDDDPTSPKFIVFQQKIPISLLAGGVVGGLALRARPQLPEMGAIAGVAVAALTLVGLLLAECKGDLGCLFTHGLSDAAGEAADVTCDLTAGMAADVDSIVGGGGSA